MTHDELYVLRALCEREQRTVKVDHRHQWDKDVSFTVNGVTARFDQCHDCGGVGLFDVVLVAPQN